MKKCLNCNAEHEGNFCPKCGQKTISGRLTMKEIISEFIQSIFFLESPLLKTFSLALHKPGVLGRNYVFGQRKRYIKPIQFFIMFLSLYYITFGFFGIHLMEGVQSSMVQPEDEEVVKYAQQKVNEMNLFMQKNINLFYFGYVPLLALYTRELFRKSKFNYAESLVFSLFTVAIDLLFTSIITFGAYFSQAFMLLRFPILFVYFPMAIMQFTGARNVGGYFKGVLVSLLTLISYMIFVTLVMAVIFILSF